MRMRGAAACGIALAALILPPPAAAVPVPR